MQALRAPAKQIDLKADEIHKVVKEVSMAF